MECKLHQHIKKPLTPIYNFQTIIWSKGHSHIVFQLNAECKMDNKAYEVVQTSAIFFWS